MTPNRFLAPALLSLIPAASFAKLDTTAFLASALKSPAVDARQSGIAGVETTGTLGWVEKAQISGEWIFGRRKNNLTTITFGSDLEKNTEDREYHLKIVPRGYSDYKAERRLQTDLWLLENDALNIETGKALEERYLAVIDHAVATSKAELYAGYLKLSEREVAVASAGNRVARASAQDLIKAREAHLSAKLQAEQAQTDLKTSASKLKSLDADLKDDKISLEDLRSPTDAEKNFPTADGAWSPSSADVSAAKHKADLELHEVDLARARSSKLIDNFGFKLEQKDDEDVYKLELTLNLPNWSSSDYSTREKARKAVLSDIEAREAERSHASDLGAAKTTFDKAMASYRVYGGLGSEAAREINERLKRIAQREDAGLVILLQKNELNEKLKRLEATAEVLKAYVTYLSLAGVLVSNPTTNYLAREDGGKAL